MRNEGPNAGALGTYGLRHLGDKRAHECLH